MVYRRVLLIIFFCSLFVGCAPKSSDNQDEFLVSSDNEVFRLRVSPNPAIISPGVSVTFDVEVIDGADRVATQEVELTFKALMPAHGHGLRKPPSVVPLGPRRFRIENVNFPMEGLWELNFYVTKGQEQGTARLELEIKT